MCGDVCGGEAAWSMINSYSTYSALTGGGNFGGQIGNNFNINSCYKTRWKVAWASGAPSFTFRLVYCYNPW